jgi:hypothetical protein
LIHTYTGSLAIMAWLFEITSLLSMPASLTCLLLPSW